MPCGIRSSPTSSASPGGFSTINWPARRVWCGSFGRNAGLGCPRGSDPPLLTGGLGIQPLLCETDAGSVPGRPPFALASGKVAIGLPVVRRENPASLRHQLVVAIHRGLDQRDPLGIHSIEEHATGGQTG